MKKIIVLFLVALMLVSSVNAAAYLKIDGIDGEATDREHKDWIVIESFSHDMSKPASRSKRQRASLNMGDLVVVKELDKSSPKIQEKMAKGEHIPKVEVHLTSSYSESGEQTYYAYELENARITSYSVSGSADDVPVEEVAFNFENIKVEYKQFDDAGGILDIIEWVWNVVRGR